MCKQVVALLSAHYQMTLVPEAGQGHGLEISTHFYLHSNIFFFYVCMYVRFLDVCHLSHLSFYSGIFRETEDLPQSLPPVCSLKVALMVGFQCFHTGDLIWISNLVIIS